MGKASRNRNRTGRTKHVLKKERNWFPIIVSLFVGIAVVGVSVFIIMSQQTERAPIVAPASASINEDTGAITMGNGATVLDEYIDFGCNHCGDWFAKSSTDISKLVEEDLLTLNMHPIAILDNGFMGTEYSTRSASATYCVAESNPEAAYPFIDFLFKNRPATGTEGLSDEDLVKFATRAGAPDAASCITDGSYKSFVSEMTLKTPSRDGSGGVSTPTLILNGEFINPNVDVQTAIVDVARAN